MKLIAGFLICLSLVACKRTAHDFFTADEKKQTLVLKELSRNDQQSIHYVLLNGAEKPHYHDRHTVKTFLISGNGRLHLGHRIVDLKTDETVTIPAGTLHWAENIGPGYCLLSAEFFPPFDGKDRRFAE